MQNYKRLNFFLNTFIHKNTKGCINIYNLLHTPDNIIHSIYKCEYSDKKDTW